VQITEETAGTFAFGSPPNTMALTEVGWHGLGKPHYSCSAHSKTHAISDAIIMRVSASFCLCRDCKTNKNDGAMMQIRLTIMPSIQAQVQPVVFHWPKVHIMLFAHYLQ
jgi:hypothetical protein